jgi:transposase
MPKSKTKFQEKWLSETDPSGHQYSLWCMKATDEYQAYCFICRKEFGCDKCGQSQLKQHSETQTHKKNSKSALSSSQSKLVVAKSQTTSSASTSQIGISTLRGEITAAEIIWAGEIAASHFSI